MAINTETLYRRLFDTLSSKGYEPKAVDARTEKDVVPEQADFITFDFDKGDGVVPVTLALNKTDQNYSLTLYYSDDVTKNGTDAWYDLQKDMRYTAQTCGINSFVLRNRNHLKPDMQKREYMKQQEQISEGYYPMGKKASYSDNVPAVKIILQHTRQIEEGEQRYRNIAKIFVENQNGERFLLPTNKPGLARVYARHISEGGTPYDERGQHINSLVEEYTKMAGFVRATRGHQFNESAQKLVESGINHYQSLRETLNRMTGRRGYSNYFESWTPPLMEDDSDTSNLNELFVQETLDPRIESVMPILSKLQKTISEMSEVVSLEEWADSLLEAPGAETLKHNQSTEKQNLKAFGLAEEDLQHPAIDDLDEATDDYSIPEGEVTDLGKEYGAPAPGKKKRSQDDGDHNPYPFSKEEDEDYFREIFRKKREAAAKAKDKGVAEDSQLNEIPDTQFHEDQFAGNYKTGPAGQWRNKGPKANKPAKVGDLVGASESVESQDTMLEGQDDLDAILRIIKK